MKAIDFIEADVRRIEHPFRHAVPVIGIALIVVGIGLGTRGDLVEAFNFSNVIPASAILLGLIFLIWLFITRRVEPLQKWLMFSALSFVALLTSLGQPQTDVSLQKFAIAERFWPETLHCLLLGLVVSFIASTFLVICTSRFLPSPNRRWQMASAWISGMCGLSALTFHCMGPLWSHIVLAHWGQIILIFPIAYLQQRLLFKSQMSRIFLDSKHLKDIQNIDT